MMFVCYAFTRGMLGFACHWPDPTLLVVILLMAKRLLK